MSTSTRFRNSHPAARRRGQTLLLLVILMILAALLGSTFIAIFSLQLRSGRRAPARAMRAPLPLHRDAA
ncbi:MAG TPA: hypothetical protein VF627_11065 [Abditibacterium sp.]